MENPIHTIIPNPMLAFVHTVISVFMGIFSFVADNVDLVIKIGTGTIGMLSGTMAFFYYREAFLEKRTARKIQNQKFNNHEK